MIKYAQILLQLCVCMKTKGKGSRGFLFLFLAEFLVLLAKEIVPCQSDLQRNRSTETCNSLLELLGYFWDQWCFVRDRGQKLLLFEGLTNRMNLNVLLILLAREEIGEPQNRRSFIYIQLHFCCNKDLGRGWSVSFKVIFFPSQSNFENHMEENRGICNIIYIFEYFK